MNQLLSYPPDSDEQKDRSEREVRLGLHRTFTVRLAAGQTFTVTGQSGLIWVTMEHDPKDYAIVAGRELCFEGPGLIVMEGLQGANSTVILSEEP